MSREAELAAAKLAAASGLRVVGLQHDGIALVGMRDGEEAGVAGRLTERGLDSSVWIYHDGRGRARADGG